MSSEPHKHLSKAPIQVAVFAIYYEFPFETFPPNNVADFDVEAKKYFPLVSPQVDTDINFKNLGTGEAKIDVGKPRVSALRYLSNDKQKNINITPNLFTYNITSSYTNWNDEINIVKILWQLYFEKILGGHFKVNRVSTRFINRITIQDMKVPSEYFNTTIFATEDVIPGIVSSYLTKYTSFLPDENIEIQVTQGFEPPVDNNFPYIFDIDVKSIQEFSETTIWPIFEKLREFKNRTFFNNLTDRTLTILL